MTLTSPSLNVDVVYTVATIVQEICAPPMQMSEIITRHIAVHDKRVRDGIAEALEWTGKTLDSREAREHVTMIASLIRRGLSVQEIKRDAVATKAEETL